MFGKGGKYAKPYAPMQGGKFPRPPGSKMVNWESPSQQYLRHTRNPLEELARELGLQPRQLWELGLFRGRLRQLPLGKSPLKRGLELSVPQELVRMGSAPPPRPLLSVLVIRWYDYFSDGKKSSDYSTMNDGLFIDLFDGPSSMARTIPGEYEVITVFISSTRDLNQLNPQHLRSMLSGKNVVAWYFVWPSTESPGFVVERDFFAFVYAMERQPVRTGWPHESHLYRILCGKLWIPQMSLNKDYRVPPTVRVHYAEFRRDARKAAERALKALMHLRNRLWGKEEVPLADFKGVVKLGFSWGGFDVLPFQGASALVAVMRKLFEQPKCENIICLVQEMVSSVSGEHRVLCIHDKATGGFRREQLWMQSVKPAGHRLGADAVGVREFMLASSSVVPSGDVALKFFKGDRMAQHIAEQQALQVVDRWLLWYRTESPEPPPVTRIDFLVVHLGRGQAEVWTCEVGECGASLCSVEVHGRNIAALNNAIVQDERGRFPVPLPNYIPRNSGWKS